ncbi:DMT family transporter [Streptomyces griseoruber]|uniref:DMT family transporter n=1 Tax=Streptomyces griseoruber TaxID=1943 RepID=UPI0007C721E1|nr:DMT family transporter [Streptomyces griseoruber]
MNSSVRDAAPAALAPVVWGSTYLVTTEFLPADRPLLAATVRALPSGLLLVLATRRLPRGIWVWRSAVLGVCNIGAFFALLFVAAYRLPGGIAALIGSLQPLVVLGLAAVLLRERAQGRHLVACLLGTSGVGLLVSASAATLDPLGVAAALGGACCMGLGIVLTKRWGRPAGVGLLAFTGWQLSIGGLFLLPLTLQFEGLPGRITTTNLAGYGYLCLVGAVLAYALWFRGVERLPAVAVSFLGLFSPVVAALLGLIVLGQRMTPLQVVGAAAVLAGIVLAQLPSSSTARFQRKAKHEHQDSPGLCHQGGRDGVPSA